MEFVVSSNNKNKLKEIRAIFGAEAVLRSLSDENLDIEIEETGTTFYENALIKAKTVCGLTGKPTLADDSGLEVEYLNGAPGVYSARYAGEPANDELNNIKLLSELEGVEKEKRKARFVSCIVIYYPNGEIISAEGTCEGIILTAPRGQSGFGYDPLFYSEELNKTFAEASAEEKNAVSHRARALHAVAQLLGL